ncbi:Putative peptidase M14, carboxypeptidase A [Colletotrichum destructivum]|uniref:Peptidase M14, carboxypeptidase A n=1 Tax=Colletotrichum destructivum TaxID=34406 RepID=A0AAX4I734_9PEZI|nr:Putative peptidase M14, carboxypeptidase A [Colletotrichum destructivum]
MGAPKHANSFKKLSKLILAALLSSGKTVRDHRLSDTAPISTIDRFHNGDKAPHGLGVNRDASPFDYKTVFNGREIGTALRGLEKEYGVQVTNPPHESYWKQKSFVGFLPLDKFTGRINTRSYSVFLTAGVQGRERGGPDSLIYFIGDLLWANKHNEGLAYGNHVYTVEQVRRVLSLGIIVFPLVNPDGHAWDQRWHNCWGNNLNVDYRPEDRSIRGIGVNIDRNYNFTWDYRHAYSELAGDVASDNPEHELFHGCDPLSEAESRNVAWVLETHPRIRWFLDVHTKGRLITHTWTNAVPQTTNTAMSFRNASYDGKRGDPAVGYGEYIRAKDLDVYQDISTSVAAQMANVSGTTFHDVNTLRKEGKTFLGASGSAIDWAYSRHTVNEMTSKVYSFKLKLGASEDEAAAVAQEGGCPYYPSGEQYYRSLKEAAVVYMTFLLNAAKHQAIEAGGGG